MSSNIFSLSKDGHAIPEIVITSSSFMSTSFYPLEVVFFDIIMKVSSLLLSCLRQILSAVFLAVFI